MYLLNAPPLFAHAWKIIRRTLDPYTRDRIVFVFDDEIRRVSRRPAIDNCPNPVLPTK